MTDRPLTARTFAIFVRDHAASVECQEGASVYSAIRLLMPQCHLNGCARGGCGVCAVRLISGEIVVLGPMSASKLALGGTDPKRKLACRIAPAGDLVIELGEGLTRIRARQTTPRNGNTE